MIHGWWRRFRWWREARSKLPSDPATLAARACARLGLPLAGFGHVFRLTDEERDDFEAFVHARFAENDAQLLRGVKTSDELSDRVRILVMRLLAERREALWNAWREEARAQGRVDAAAALDRLIYEEALAPEKACETIAGDDAEEQGQLAALWARKPWKWARKVDDRKWRLASSSDLDLSMLKKRLSGIEAELISLLRTFDGGQRIILQLCFVGRLPVDVVALAVGRSSRRVGRSIDDLVERLRSGLARAGFEVNNVGALLADPRPQYLPKARV